MTNKLHFTEIEWVIYFPSIGNQGRKIENYGVAYRDRMKKKTQVGIRINLSDVLTQPFIKTNYPHNVALFQKSVGKGSNWKPEYIEERTIRNEEDLIDWIEEFEENQF